MKFSNHLPQKITAHVGKGGGVEMLPSRHALNLLTKGDPLQRSFNNYAKLVPSGANAPGTYADIIHMGRQPKVG